MKSIIRLDPTAPLTAWPDFPETEISSGARSSKGHFWLTDEKYGLTIGLWESAANIGRWMNWPVDEFMVVVEGEVVMIEEDRETIIGPGECFFIPKGRRCIWNQAGYFKKIMVMFNNSSQHGAEGTKPIFKIDPGIELRPSEPPPPEALISAAPIQHAHSYFYDTTRQFEVGVWHTTACQGKLVTSQCHELMHIIEGAVTLTDENGLSQNFEKGDTLLVPLGVRNSWQSEGTLRKVYCILEPRK
jgi:uncharacterized cupin superfamily protein